MVSGITSARVRIVALGEGLAGLAGLAGLVAFAGLLAAPAGAAPVAVARAAPTKILRGMHVTFSQDLSHPSDASRSIVSYEWDFLGDGTYDLLLTNPLITPVYTYLNIGMFNATLRVTDDLGLAGTDSVLITVLHEPEFPPACDAGGPYTFGPGQSLTLAATASDPNFDDVLTAAWDIDGDGQFDDATGLAPTIPFAVLYPLALGHADGRFDIMLRVTDQTGRVAMAPASVSYAVPAPTAAVAGMGLMGGMCGIGAVRGLRRLRRSEMGETPQLQGRATESSRPSSVSFRRSAQRIHEFRASKRRLCDDIART